MKCNSDRKLQSRHLDSASHAQRIASITTRVFYDMWWGNRSKMIPRKKLCHESEHRGHRSFKGRLQAHVAVSDMPLGRSITLSSTTRMFESTWSLSLVRQMFHYPIGGHVRQQADSATDYYNVCPKHTLTLCNEALHTKKKIITGFEV